MVEQPGVLARIHPVGYDGSVIDAVDEETGEPLAELMDGLLNRRGYIVFESPVQCSPGEVFTDGQSDGLDLDHPFVVLAETDASDFWQQAKVVGWDVSRIRQHFAPCWYYRVTSD